MIIKWKNKTKKNFRSYVKISSSSVHRVTHKTFSQFLKVDLLEMIRGDWLKWLKAQCCQIFWSHWILSLNCPSAFSAYKIQQNHRWPSLPASTSSTKLHQLRTRNWAVGRNISGKTVCYSTIFSFPEHCDDIVSYESETFCQVLLKKFKQKKI